MALSGPKYKAQLLEHVLFGFSPFHPCHDPGPKAMCWSLMLQSRDILRSSCLVAIFSTPDVPVQGLA